MILDVTLCAFFDHFCGKAFHDADCVATDTIKCIRRIHKQFLLIL